MNRRRNFAMGLVIMATLTIAGCTGAAPVTGPIDSPGVGKGWLQEQFQLGLPEATSDFERDVLTRASSTGAIAPGDYEEAVTRYLQCTSAAGYTIDTEKQANGIYRWLPQNIDDAHLQAYIDDTTACARGTTMIIEGLYKVQVANPDGLDQASAMARCLITYDVVDASYTSADFTKDFGENFAHAPYTVKDPNVIMCLTSLGFAVPE